MHTMPKRQTSARARVSAGDCGCGDTGTRSGKRSAFSFGVLERPRYYPRQLMTPDDLLLEADYFRDRLRRHNMFLHGWGVVCGALVCVVPKRRKPGKGDLYERQPSSLRAGSDYQTIDANGNGHGGNEPWLVQVLPGYILGPYGDEIVIDQPVDVPLRGGGVSGCGADSGDDLADPWCSEVFVDRRTDPFFIAIRYRECPVRPVRAQPGGCGCDEEPCEFSRFRDSFEIGFLDCCPDSHDPDMSKPGYRRAGNPACPECPDNPWVVLAEITVDDAGTVTRIDNCSCRRIMATTRDRWTVCQGTDCDQPDRDNRPDSTDRPEPAVGEPIDGDDVVVAVDETDDAGTVAADAPAAQPARPRRRPR